ncbi:MAG: hypothetical protein R3C10_04805 [Pirellulales bacterium]
MPRPDRAHADQHAQHLHRSLCAHACLLSRRARHDNYRRPRRPLCRIRRTRRALAICERAVMQRLGLSAGYDNPAQGQAFGLAFECSCAEDVNRRLAELVDAGAERRAVGNRMPWGQYTAFFADPDGHIHELFAWPD